MVCNDDDICDRLGSVVVVAVVVVISDDGSEEFSPAILVSFVVGLLVVMLFDCGDVWCESDVSDVRVDALLCFLLMLMGKKKEIF